MVLKSNASHLFKVNITTCNVLQPALSPSEHPIKRISRRVNFTHEMADEPPTGFLSGIIEASQIQDAQNNEIIENGNSVHTVDEIPLPLPTLEASASPQPKSEDHSPRYIPPFPILDPKAETSKTSRDDTPASSDTGLQDSFQHATKATIDKDSLKAITKLKNEHGLRTAKSNSSAIPSDIPKSISRKRSAPKLTTPVKKGLSATAALKNQQQPGKKRRVESDTSRVGTPVSSRRSATPASSRTCLTPALAGNGALRIKKSHNGTPAAGSSPAAFDLPATPAESDDDRGLAGEEGGNGDLFCICRRPDNHTWMIACDGGCDDWLHGKCVNIKEEDGDLIDRYICPNCAAKDRGVTTWKPMCRTPGCRKPARLKKGNVSKYCSDECGLQFFRLALQDLRPSDENVCTLPSTNRRKSKTHQQSNFVKSRINNDVIMGTLSDGSRSDSTRIGPRGGRIQSQELKVLVDEANDIDAFRSLGIGMPSPPPTPSSGTPSKDADVQLDSLFPPTFSAVMSSSISKYLTESERNRIASINVSKEELRSRRTLLYDREQFVVSAYENVKKYAEREGLKIKDVCGFDARIVWSDTEFAQLCNDKRENGDVVEDTGVSKINAHPEVEIGDHQKQQHQKGDRVITKAEDECDEKNYVCLRKRCERHRFWPKVAMGDLKCEETDAITELHRLEEEEQGIRERAIIRVRQIRNGVHDGGKVEIVGDYRR